MQINARVSKTSKKREVIHFFKSAARKIVGSQYGTTIYIHWLQL
jgi:hypothetical protein